MNSILEQLYKESEHIGNFVFPAISRQAEEARERGDIEGLKDAIRKQWEANNRMDELNRMMEASS